MDAKPSLLTPPGSILISSPIKPNPLDLPQLQHRAAVIPPMVSAIVRQVKLKHRDLHRHIYSLFYLALGLFKILW